MELYNRAYRLDPEIDGHIDHERLATEISKKDLSEIEPFYNPFRKLMIQNDPVDKELYLQIAKSQLNPETSEKAEKGGGGGGGGGRGGVFRLNFKEEPNLLADLPSDVLDKILEYLGWMYLPSLETVSATSRSLYLTCRQESLWKNLCNHMECCKRETLLFDDCWRMQYIMRPTFRTDGVYISKITYFRQGYQESAISQPSHLVTYYRYLRFFNGPGAAGKRIVTALVSTEKPRQVIDSLKELDEKTMKSIKERFSSDHDKTSKFKNYKGKNDKRDNNTTFMPISSKPNLFIGTYWRQIRPDSDRFFSLVLFDAHSKNPMRLRMTMELADPLKGAPAYRTAKCTEYIGKVFVTNWEGDSEDKIDFDTNNWGKFYFSRVKSYI